MRILLNHLWPGVLAAIIPLQLQAAEWTAEPAVKLRTGYNDNIRLDTVKNDPVWEKSLTPSVKFGVASENKGLFGRASASVRRFSGGSGRNSSSLLDREDYRFLTDAFYKTERNEFNADLNIIQDSTLDSQLDETGLVEGSRATRLKIALGPSWSHTLNEKTLINLGYQFTTVSFSDEQGFRNLIEYDYDVFSASLLRSLTPRVQATLAASYSSYQPESIVDSVTLKLQVGITRSFSETLTTSWLAGVRETTSDTRFATGFCVGADPGATFPICNGPPGSGPVITGTDTDEVDNNGSVYSMDITKLLETGQIRASLSRAANPGSDGELLQTTRLTLSGVRKFSETLESSLTITYSNAETIVSSAGIREKRDQDLLRIRPRLTWQFDRQWELAGAYEYIEKEDKRRGDETATSNSIYLSLSYRPTRISLSR
jgi:hypothetical protein